MQLKSSKQIIGSLITDINLDISDIEHRLFEWIDMALDIMDITKHHILVRDIIEIKNINIEVKLLFIAMVLFQK